MTEGEFPFRSFTMRSEGYDQGEVDAYVDDLQREIVEKRRALESAARDDAASNDTRLHDPEGAVTRTLAIAQETADRVLHDAQVEADRRRAEADEHASEVIADADERAARLLGDMETQAAEVREQGVAAARSAIQVERDKAMSELSHVRRIRDDLRTEAVDLKSALDQYRSQSREAADTLAAASAGPLMSVDLPDFIDDDVLLAGISASDEPPADDMSSADPAEVAMGDEDVAYTESPPATDNGPDESTEVSNTEGSYLRAVDDEAGGEELASQENAEWQDGGDLAEVISIDPDSVGTGESDGADDDDDADGFGGTFLAEVRAAAEDDDIALSPENEESDRFLSELRGIADEPDEELDSDAADKFFDD